MLRHISKRERNLALITITFLITVFFYNFVLEPLANKWALLDKKIKDKENTLAKYSRILADKEGIENLHMQFVKYQVTKKSQDEDSAIALSAIEKCARDSGVAITGIKPITAKTQESHRIITFRVVSESTLSSLTKFVYDLQSSYKLIKIQRMVLQAKEGSPGTIKSVANITKLTIF